MVRITHPALELAINQLFDARRFGGLAELVSDGRIAALEGDPGWTLERRGPGDTWPEGAEFRACVDPEVLELAEPETFYARAAFASAVLSILDQRLAVSHEQLVKVRRDRIQLRNSLASLLESLEKMMRN